jgi:thioredoxin reductase (NADPH)
MRQCTGKREKMDKIYDVIILGGGPAGLSAGLYAGRSRLSTLIIEKGQDGGQIAITDEIENYPGQMVDGESGPELIARMTAQSVKFGAERVSDTIKEVSLEGEVKVLKGEKEEYKGKNVIIATGAHPRPIGCKGEREYLGKGVSYCATCDANFFEDLEVFVVGGGDSAVEEAMYLTKFARKVTVIHRRNELRAAKSIQEKAFANPKLHFMWDSVVEELYGDDILQGMAVKNVKTGETRKIDADPEDGMFGVFGFIGMIPNTKVFEGILHMDERGYIKTDEDMHTNIPGVYAAGDVRVKSLRQVVTASADGAIAAVQVERSLSDYF